MNTLKSFVRNISERTEDRKVSSTTEVQNVEGFLCPQCMNPFESAEALHFHFNNDHINNDDTPNISMDYGDLEDESLDSRDKQSIYSEGSLQFPKTPSESDKLNGSVSDFSLSQSKLHLSKDECSRCIDLTQEHASQLTALETKVESMNQDLSRKNKEIDDQKHQLSQEVSYLKEIIQSKSDEIIVLKESVEDLKDNKNEFVQSESAKLSELSKKLEETQSLYGSQSKELNVLKKKYEDAKLEKEQLTCVNFEKEKKESSLEKIISELRSQVTQSEQDRGKLLKEIELGEGTNMALDQLKQENEQLSKQIKMEKSASQKLGEDLQSQISKLNQELIETKSKCLSLSDSLEESKEKVCSITSKYDALSATKEDVSLQLDSKEKVIADQNKKYKELQSKLNHASEKNLKIGIEKKQVNR
ncbi:uncharacterized protein [Lepeophtheirus salmonis]|uniref:uncharacterized protein n=1 Tax=Lepeophtheirus salmonis TaxID=72036 RepID=UPI001AE98755|nr:early endosome antigen 1-like isoform X1 [Lepeophtheirus salmonis]